MLMKSLEHLSKANPLNKRVGRRFLIIMHRYLDQRGSVSALCSACSL